MVFDFDNSTSGRGDGASVDSIFLKRCEESYIKVQNFLNDTLPGGPVPETHKQFKFDPDKRKIVKEKVRKSMMLLSRSIDTHGLKELAISYNGGKDCLVVLVLFLAVIHQKIKQEGRSSLVAPVFEAGYKLDTVYVNTEPPFPELSNFIHKSTVYYHLNHIMINSSLKEGFEKYLTKVNPEVKAIIIGIRYSDPYGSNLKYEQDTDHHWPNFLRIHPILHWNYVDIWDFLIGCNIEYCEMYDEGYTSLGGIKCTTRNPYLRRSDVKGYNPAYMLEENADIVERSGRTK